MKKLDKAIIGACGEHYVAAYLSGRKLIVAMPRAGIPGFDMIVSSEKGGRSVQVQVKTGTQSTKKDKDLGQMIYLWPTSYSVIERDDENLWYAYVWLRDWPKEDTLPKIFFVPAKVVVEVMRGCKEDGDSWPWFWMTFDEAQAYEGEAGFRLLQEGLNSQQG